MAQVDNQTIDDVAFALLMAAILLRDMTDAMPVSMKVNMPPDIRVRLHDSMYQDSFERLPDDVKDRAREAVESNPTIVVARAVDAGGRSEHE